MTQKIVISADEWKNPGNRCKYASELEAGNLLFFSQIPFAFPVEDIAFLLQQKQGSSSARKNIAYKPVTDRITNHETKDPVASEQLHQVLRRFSRRAVDFLSLLLAPYAAHWKLDYASFRPFQEKGRDLRLRARNDLLHVDAFPTRPMHGSRILRFFININPDEPRRWMTTSGLGELAKQFGGKDVPFPENVAPSWLKNLRRLLKLPVRSPYDTFMLELHNFLKENAQFQETCPKNHWEFPPGSCWAVFTDQVSHAALSGQYALEQTLIVPRTALLKPELSPVSVLERLSGRNMVDAAELVK